MTKPHELPICGKRCETLFDAIAHGDDEHRAWLKEAIDAHLAGQPVPAARGSGRKAAVIERLVEALGKFVVIVRHDELLQMDPELLAVTEHGDKLLASLRQ